MFQPTPAARSNPLVKRVLAASFPSYRGRKITVRPYTGPTWITAFWDEGNKDEVAIIDLTRGVGTLKVSGSPWTNRDGCLAQIDQPVGSILVIHHLTRGTESITIIARDAAVPFLPVGQRLLEGGSL